MLDTAQSTKFKPSELLTSAKNLSLCFVILLSGITYIGYSYTADRSVLLIGFMITIFATFPFALYYLELERLYKKRRMLRRANTQ